jgi:hypothetical protein
MGNWGNKEEVEQYRPRGGSFWGKLEEGDNKLRLVSGYKHIAYHWQGMGTPSAVCLGEKCSFCKQKKMINGKEYLNTPSSKFVVNCIDLSDPKNLSIKHYELPFAIIDAINGYALDPEYKFDELPGWDMIINKETKGEKKVNYTLRAARQNRELSEAEKSLMEGFETPEDVVKYKTEKALEENSVVASGSSVVTANDEEEVDIEDIPF